MKKTLVSILLCVQLAISCLTVSCLAFADPIMINNGDTLEKLLTSQKGKKVTIKLDSGQELTGTVKEITNQLVHLGELSGKEFYDAVIATGKIEAVVVRAKE